MKNTSPILPLIAAATILIGLFCFSVNNERAAAVNAEWAAAAAPIFEARGIPFPKNPTPRDLQEALGSHVIVISAYRSAGQIEEEIKVRQKALVEKPSF